MISRCLASVAIENDLKMSHITLKEKKKLFTVINELKKAKRRHFSWRRLSRALLFSLSPFYFDIDDSCCWAAEHFLRGTHTLNRLCHSKCRFHKSRMLTEGSFLTKTWTRITSSSTIALFDIVKFLFLISYAKNLSFFPVHKRKSSYRHRFRPMISQTQCNLVEGSLFSEHESVEPSFLFRSAIIGSWHLSLPQSVSCWIITAMWSVQDPIDIFVSANISGKMDSKTIDSQQVIDRFSIRWSQLTGTFNDECRPIEKRLEKRHFIAWSSPIRWNSQSMVLLIWRKMRDNNTSRTTMICTPWKPITN